MKPLLASHLLAPLALLSFATTAVAQVPDGSFVFGTFGSASIGVRGLFYSHPRNQNQITPIQNLQGDLTRTGSSCVVYRESDGMILAGERAPIGGSVDLHMIKLSGDSVLFDASFSLGQGGSCCGEIPQMSLLPDGRVVVAVTDIDSGPLKNILTTSYGWQGVGIVDTTSGLITPINVTNGNIITAVFNGMTVHPDFSKVYLCTWNSSTQGDVWEVPIQGGPATLTATLPAGCSNMSFGSDGLLYVTCLNSQAPLYSVDVNTGVVTNIPQANGQLNAISQEKVTGEFGMVSASSGVPGRSVFWMERNGTAHLLSTPGLATPSGISAVPNPREVGEASPGNASYTWRVPHPGGLPTLGNSSFSILVEGTGAIQPGWMVASLGVAETPTSFLGADIYLELSQILFSAPVPAPPVLMPIGIPSDPGLLGFSIYFQSVHTDGAFALAATSPLKVTII